jgi:CopG family transcriptional regulator / antitoxin EndoAI
LFCLALARRMTVMTPITIRIPDELNKRLRKLCRSENRAASEVLRDCLRRYLALKEFEAIRRKTVPLAKAQGIHTDEDVFRIVS